ncbi:uncharacterized protein LOC113470122 [Diaphorina citri]|uniref:Uncharacterized protein LOC113470122 n=1 Tax=Diaphorina citri TaxID=121845 RepID=A0A3Q0JBM9_DIACI|nr:uncharacterized protein LOC113470122 [Diaphorina citri]
MAKRRCTLEKKPKPTAKVVKRIAPLISALDVPSIRFLTDLLERCGLVNFYRQDARRNRLQDLYCRLQHSLLLFFMAVHFLSTITRAVHYLPVFIECFFEDVVMFNFYAQICIYRRRHRQISALTAIMEKSFSRANEGIVRADARVIRTVFYLFVMAVGGVAVATLLVALIPLTQAETDIRRQLYNMKYPERLLPSEVKIPFVDESELPNYVFIFVFFAYIVLVSLILAAITINMIPFVTIHLRRQYSMLCNFVEKLGAPHTDLLGNEIRYTDIETNAYRVCGNSIGVNARATRQRREAERRLYHRNYVKQIIRFHQKLLAFQNEVREIAFN